MCVNTARVFCWLYSITTTETYIHTYKVSFEVRVAVDTYTFKYIYTICQLTQHITTSEGGEIE